MSIGADMLPISLCVATPGAPAAFTRRRAHQHPGSGCDLILGLLRVVYLAA